MDSFCHKYRKIEFLNRSIVGIHHSKLLELLLWIALKLYLHIRIVLLFVLGLSRQLNSQRGQFWSGDNLCQHFWSLCGTLC